MNNSRGAAEQGDQARHVPVRDTLEDRQRGDDMRNMFRLRYHSLEGLGRGRSSSTPLMRGSCLRPASRSNTGIVWPGIRQVTCLKGLKSTE